MTEARVLPKPIIRCVVLLLLSFVSARPLFGQESLRNSSRECAICHIRWADADFSAANPQDKVMQSVLDRKAGSGEMCLSCHDGSVVDSRFKVWATRHHSTDVVPSPTVKIPTDKFPLDDKGHMTCATCHTAHAVSNSSDIRTVIFLRQPNVNSSFCISCHSEHAEKNDFQHPMGHSEAAIPQSILAAGGKTSGDGHMIFCQTCHEPHGAQNPFMLVLPVAQLCVSCHKNKMPEPNSSTTTSPRRTYHGIGPSQTSPDVNAVKDPNAELDCVSCHRLHDAADKPLLTRKNENGSFCLECHKDKQGI
ncbi:MAG: cytochrome c3 family protein, partial [Sideroxyarcus sp.]|nr:cytochrome c3 family protein [Sideroxyarcus sp.]